MSHTPSDSAPPAHAIYRLVPFAHVESVEASLAFYAMLGFRPTSVMRTPSGRAFWAMAQSGTAEIMFAQADEPVDARQQAVLFYMYGDDVSALRGHLLASGVRDGRMFSGAGGSGDSGAAVFEIVRRDYMPAGELRVHDPDGYVILVGQLS